ncbi:hypothetical protein FRC17_003003 [Serendipita sp. 399]|nr:hypothetical protein FRC17_003003 [Serendipita sp. 399]
MDGTLVRILRLAIDAWSFLLIWILLSTNLAHAVRTVENLKRFCGITDPEELEREANRFELEIVNASKRNGGTGIVILPNAKETLAPLQAGTPKEGKQIWAICTSATRAYATAALETVGITQPEAFVTAGDVTRGKPNGISPEPYLIGAKLCSVDPSKCLVVEDAPNGIRSGKAAGAKVLAVLTSHTREAVQAAEPDWIVPDLTTAAHTKLLCVKSAHKFSWTVNVDARIVQGICIPIPRAHGTIQASVVVDEELVGAETLSEVFDRWRTVFTLLVKGVGDVACGIRALGCGLVDGHRDDERKEGDKGVSSEHDR